MKETSCPNQTADKHITGNIGLYYVCYRLSKNDWNAMPTSRNSRGADIIAVKGDDCIGIQVKSLSAKADVRLGRNYREPFVHYWIIVTDCRNKKNEPAVYVIPSEDIIKERLDPNNQNNGLVTFDPAKEPETEPNSFYLSHTFLKKSGLYLNRWDLLGKRDSQNPAA